MNLWIPIQVNPEPWRVGPLSTVRNKGKLIPYIGKDAQLDAYKEAVKEGVSDWLTTTGHSQKAILERGANKVTFYFWRQLAQYTTNTGRRHTKHQADATNMQKATEDALQGILFANDRQNLDVRSVIIEQGSQNTEGWVVINLQYVLPEVLDADVPADILNMIENKEPQPALFTPTGSIDTDWSDPEDTF